MSKSLSLIIAFFLCVSILQLTLISKSGSTKECSANSESTTIVVPDNYTKIQEAIDVANPEDTIYVRNGTYCENLFINKTISLVGENPEITIIDGGTSNEIFSPVVYIYGENVSICNFTIRGSNNAWGIFILSHANARIENNIIANNSGGIIADISDNNTFINNTVTNNKSEGILFFYSSGNIMRNNTISGNEYNFGISGSSFNHDIDMSNRVNGRPICYLKNQSNLIINPHSFPDVGYLALINCTNITVENLNLTNNYDGLLLAETKNSSISGNNITSGGIELAYSSFVNLTRNAISNGESGISIYHSGNNTVAENNITQNNYYGISLLTSSCNTVFSNDVKNSRTGFEVTGSSNNNTIFANNITDNEYYGFLLCGSSYNKILHNNFINNGLQAVCSQFPSSLCLNDWDNGYPSGGNCWSDYNGTDLYSGTYPQSENGSDGIGDTFYNSYSAVDRYPLMQPIKTFEAGVWEGKTCNIGVISNSTVSNFKLDKTAKTISLNVSRKEGTAGFCRIIIPNVIVQGLWNNSYSILVNGELWPFRNWTDTEDTYIYINYTHSEHEIMIIPEFPKATILTIFMMIATFVITAKKKLAKSHRNLV